MLRPQDVFLAPRSLRSAALVAMAIAGLVTGAAMPSIEARAQTVGDATTVGAQVSATTAGDGVALQAAIPSDCSTPTPSETEGPYFKSGSPETTTIATADTPGTPLVLTGYVVDTSCQPIAGALLDFWQADGSGTYDSSGYALRGHQYTDANGFFQLTTVEPGLYPGRTRHIHVKVQAPGQPAITTQLYFPGDPNNARDGTFAENGQSLLLNVQQADDGSLSATFTFILAAQ